MPELVHLQLVGKRTENRSRIGPCDSSMFCRMFEKNGLNASFANCGIGAVKGPETGLLTVIGGSLRENGFAALRPCGIQGLHVGRAAGNCGGSDPPPLLCNSGCAFSHC